MRRDERGTTAVEVLLVTMIVIPLIFGGIELTRGITIKESLDRGAFEGARYFAIHGNETAARNQVRAASANGVFPLDPSKVSVTISPNAGLKYGDAVCVEASYDTDLDLALVSMFSVRLRGRHCTAYERFP